MVGWLVDQRPLDHLYHMLAVPNHTWPHHHHIFPGGSPAPPVSRPGHLSGGQDPLTQVSHAGGGH